MNKKQIWTLSGILLIILVLYFAPRTPPSSGEKPQSVEERIAVAVNFIQSSSDPMKGIAMLKEIAAENPDNTHALYYLGYFSILSGQFEKAISHFTRILELDPGNQEALLLIGNAYAGMGNYQEAINYLSNYKATLSDRKSIQEIEDQISRLASQDSLGKDAGTL